MFCNCPTELCCLPELSPGLHSQRPPSTSPAWSPGSSGSSSSLPCPMVGILHPDNQHVPPEWLLRGFSLSTPLHRRTHHPTASPVFSMQMTLAGKTREVCDQRPPMSGVKSNRSFGRRYLSGDSWQLCSAPSPLPSPFHS
ncbi:cardiotrophin-like cytokine factor 1 isoform 2 [Rattus norvegicus]|uniref:cardiotrophin-like cytokine factor 1 isoform 2 n=1 Tax=Rattus norvegicus TaxID=10116 RepID=UPI001E68D45F|nr:cardiotrophin-like cytokine factor 1 isoform 2 [Rattus norvegicus]